MMIRMLAGFLLPLLPIEEVLLWIFILCYAGGITASVLYLFKDEESLSKWYFSFFTAGIVFNIFNLIYRGVIAKRVPFSNTYEVMVISLLGAVGVFLFFTKKFEIYKMSGLISPSLILLIIGLIMAPGKEIRTMAPILKSPWLIIHVGIMILPYGTALISFFFAIIYLIRDRIDRRNPPGESCFFARVLPTEKKLDEILFSLNRFFLPLFALIIITGSIWADCAWGRYWGWDPKESWSLITFFIYTSYFFARNDEKIKGKTAVIIVIIAFLSLIFTFLGVNYILPGLHSYAR